MTAATTEIERILVRVTAGDANATAELTALLYQDLKRMAEAQLRRNPGGATLQATALVHEAFLRLNGAKDPRWEGRAHFLGSAARAMRRVISNYARARLTSKRGGGRTATETPAEHIEIGLDLPVEDLVALDEALTQLEREHPRQAQVVMLRYYAGLDEAEICSVLHVSNRTVRRDWNLARLFLARAFGVDGLDHRDERTA